MINNLAIIELKRPSHEIEAADNAQLVQYKTIVREHQTNYIVINSYLVGRKFGEAVRDRDLEKAGIFLKSYSEIVKEARERYKEIGYFGNGKSSRPSKGKNHKLTGFGKFF